MIESIAAVFTAFGLSTSAGLNAYLPLLIVALTAKYTDLITLQAPFDALTNPWVIAVLVVLLLIEVVADKVPLVDHANDVIQTIIRPAAGAILFAGTSNAVSDIHPVLAMALGILSAGGVHATKALVRPVVTTTTGGLGNPVVSIAEDILAFVVSVMSILVPILTFIALMVSGVLLWRWWRKRKRLRALNQPSAATGPPATS